MPFPASDGRSPLWATTAAAQAIRGQAAEVGEATAWLARGLAQRADHARLHGEALAVYDGLRAEGAEMPPGVAVCEDCDWVFTTARKRAASKCPACHKRSSQPEREPWHVHVAVEQTYDAAGLPSGWTTRYLVQCVGCSARPFWSKRRDRKHCSPACRVRAHRARTIS